MFSKADISESKAAAYRLQGKIGQKVAFFV
jgi:hypothetical protein